MEFTIYGDDKTGISIKKDIRLEFRWELGAVDVDYGYDDLVGFTDVFNSFASA